MIFFAFLWFIILFIAIYKLEIYVRSLSDNDNKKKLLLQIGTYGVMCFILSTIHLVFEVFPDFTISCLFYLCKYGPILISIYILYLIFNITTKL